MTQVFKDRLARTRAMMHEHNVGALFFTNEEEGHPEHIKWLTGFEGSSACCLIMPKEAIFITDFRYDIRARGEVVSGWDIIIEPVGSYVPKTLKRLNVERVGILGSQMTVNRFLALSEKLRETEVIPLSDVFQDFDPLVSLQSIKGDSEIKLITKATRKIEKALGFAMRHAEEGVDEEYLSRMLSSKLPYEVPVSFPSIIGSGPNTAIPHHAPTSRELQRGDIVQFDVGCVVEGYCSDISRVGVVGYALPEHVRMHRALQNAISSALEFYRPGASMRDASLAANEILESYDFPPVPHGLGHGIGMRVHEMPIVNSSTPEDFVFEAGQVVTCEPGIYIEGYGGMRIERMVLITEDGHRLLDTNISDELRIF